MAFKKTKEVHLERRNVHYQAFEEEELGTRHLHVELKGEQDKTFMIAFPTPVTTEDGRSHILEHMVFCGSKHYPVKAIFLNLGGRTLASHKNAITSDDYTFYFFTTSDEQDFLNMARLYLDMVFNPLLNPLDFKQEAWRYELTEKSVNPTGSIEGAEASERLEGLDGLNEKNDTREEILTRQGVVLNEMKGLTFDENRYLKAEVNRIIKPQSHEKCASGVAAHIPEATFEAIKAFHQKHYHPSRAVIMTSGSVEVGKVQKLIQEMVLQGQYFASERGVNPLMNSLVNPLVDSLAQPDLKPDTESPAKPYERLAPIAPEPLNFFKEDLEADVPYPVQASSPNAHAFRVIWAWDEKLSSAEKLEKRVIARVIQKALKLKMPSHSTRLSCSFKASKQESGHLEICFDEFPEEEQQWIRDETATAIWHLAEHGLPENLYTEVMDEMREEALELEGEETGFQMVIRHLLSASMYGHDPINKLRPFELFDDIFEKVKDQQFLKDELKKMLQRPCAQLRIHPDHEMMPRLQEQEAQKLLAYQKSLSAEGIERIKAESAALKRHQEREVDFSCLPSINLLELPELPSVLGGLRFEVSESGPSLMSVRKEHGTANTNKVSLDLHFNLNAITADEISALDLYLDLLYNESLEELKVSGASKKAYDQASKIAMGYQISFQPKNSVDAASAGRKSAGHEKAAGSAYSRLESVSHVSDMSGVNRFDDLNSKAEPAGRGVSVDLCVEARGKTQTVTELCELLAQRMHPDRLQKSCAPLMRVTSLARSVNGVGDEYLESSEILGSRKALRSDDPLDEGEDLEGKPSLRGDPLLENGNFVSGRDSKGDGEVLRGAKALRRIIKRQYEEACEQWSKSSVTFSKLEAKAFIDEARAITNHTKGHLSVELKKKRYEDSLSEEGLWLIQKDLMRIHQKVLASPSYLQVVGSEQSITVAKGQCSLTLKHLIPSQDWKGEDSNLGSAVMQAERQGVRHDVSPASPGKQMSLDHHLKIGHHETSEYFESPERLDRLEALGRLEKIERLEMRMSLEGSANAVSSSLKSVNVPGPVNKVFHTGESVNQCRTVLKVPEENHPDVGVIKLVAELMESYLMNEVRVKRGAYACFARYDESGSFCMVSIDDPHVKSTLELFEAAIGWVMSHPHTAEEIKNAKVAVIKRLEPSMSWENKVLLEIAELKARTNAEIKRLQRERLLQCSPDDIKACAERYLLSAPKSTTVVVSDAGLKEVECLGFDVIRVKSETDQITSLNRFKIK